MENGSKNGENQMLRSPRGNEEELAWLAGIVDGEGHLNLRVHSRGIIEPILMIGSTSKILLEKVCRIVHGITGYEYALLESAVNRAGVGARTKDFYNVRLGRQRNVRLVCSAILPYLVTKVREAAILIAFCQLRREKLEAHDVHYAEAEHDLVRLIHDPDSSTCRDQTCRPSQEGDVMIQPDFGLIRLSKTSWSFVGQPTSNKAGNNGETPLGQSRGNQTDLAWLAGIVDGEGCLNFVVEGKRAAVVRTLFMVGNTDRRMIEEVQALVFKYTHVKPRIYEQTKRHDDGSTFQYYLVQFIRHSMILALLPKILPHLAEKQEMAELLLEFCALRKVKRHKGYNTKYGAEELAIIKRSEPFRRIPFPASFGPVEAKSSPPDRAALGVM